MKHHRNLLLFFTMLILVPLAGEPKFHPFGGDFSAFRVSFGSPVFLLFLLLVLCCARVAARAKDAYGQVLAMGIMLLVAGQAAANLLMVAGVGPVVGVPLPFISYGGSSLIVTMMAMGILLNICKQGAEHQKFRRMQAAKEKQEQALEQEKARQGGSARLYRVK